MGMMLILGVTWLALAVTVAVVIGRAIRVADARTVPGVPDRLSGPESDAQVLPLTLTRPRTLA